MKEGNASEEAEWTKGGKNNRKISVREVSLFMYTKLLNIMSYL